MSMISLWQQSCCEKMTRWSMETVLTLVSKNGRDPKQRAIFCYQYRINRRPGRLPRVSDNAIDWERHIEHQKSSVRCKVEHPYRIVKNIFGFRKTVYRGLSKNLNRLYVLFASANLYMLVRAGGTLPSA